jgi:hypothetical protein
MTLLVEINSNILMICERRNEKKFDSGEVFINKKRGIPC